MLWKTLVCMRFNQLYCDSLHESLPCHHPIFPFSCEVVPADTMDLYVATTGSVRLMDFNPVGGSTVPLLFEWEELGYGEHPTSPSLIYSMTDAELLHCAKQLLCCVIRRLQCRWLCADTVSMQRSTSNALFFML